jgi:hypothetical protein
LPLISQLQQKGFSTFQQMLLTYSEKFTTQESTENPILEISEKLLKSNAITKGLQSVCDFQYEGVFFFFL